MSNLEERLTAVRRDLHQHPELSNQEFETTRKIRAFLEESAIPILDFPLKTGIIAEIAGDKPGKLIALRSDIDALPIQEQTELPFRSVHPGIMHACGHEIHTAALLGAALLLQEHRADLAGTVRFIFQPAEETSHGASSILQAGVLEGVAAIFGVHNDPSLPVGTFGTKTGALTASVDRFEVTITGKGAHAAKPNEGKDAISAGAELVQNLERIISRVISPASHAVISVTQFHSGSTWNVLPEQAYLEGTVRTFDQSVRQQIQAEMTRVTEGLAHLTDTEIRFNWYNGAPAINNDEALTELAFQVASELGLTTRELQEMAIGEDFAFYQEKVPGAFVMIGSESEFDLHHPKIEPNEAVILQAAHYFEAVALAYLAK